MHANEIYIIYFGSRNAVLVPFYSRKLTILPDEPGCRRKRYHGSPSELSYDALSIVLGICSILFSEGGPFVRESDLS